jgi:flavin-dependent thymidylate synthase
LKIILAGYNVEVETLDRISTQQDGEILTPEIFSAAYARISRSPKDIVTLRKNAREDVGKARRSNKTIIFQMGHHSVAEHAVFNFDLIGISRLAMEELEKFRLVSYTEKSQRYVTLKGDFVVPREISANADIKLFKETIQLQNDFYQKAFQKLKESLFDTNPHLIKTKPQKQELENLAKEDARYIISLATKGQVGMTINARNLEHLLRRLATSKRQEVLQIRSKMYEQVKPITPSIILFSEPSNFEKMVNQDWGFKLENQDGEDTFPAEPEIVQYSENGDDLILAAYISVKHSVSFVRALSDIKKMAQGRKEEIFHNLFQNLEFFDSLTREFEMPDITFQALVSASNYAQLKRHRLATILAGDYRVEYANTIPRSLVKAGLETDFLGIIEATNQTYRTLKKSVGTAADYILTNSHRRQVLVKMNLRELFHFIRLREDEHAQWDIRELASAIGRKIRALMPLSTRLLCGKSNYPDTFMAQYNKKPDFCI